MKRILLLSASAVSMANAMQHNLPTVFRLKNEVEVSVVVAAILTKGYKPKRYHLLPQQEFTISSPDPIATGFEYVVVSRPGKFGKDSCYQFRDKLGGKLAIQQERNCLRITTGGVT